MEKIYKNNNSLSTSLEDFPEVIGELNDFPETNGELIDFDDAFAADDLINQLNEY